MFGTVSSPALRTMIDSLVLCASCCWSGKLASMTSTAKFPSGSFSSWRSAPPQPVTAIKQASGSRHASFLASKSGEHTTARGGEPPASGLFALARGRDMP